MGWRLLIWEEGWMSPNLFGGIAGAHESPIERHASEQRAMTCGQLSSEKV